MMKSAFSTFSRLALALSFTGACLFSVGAVHAHHSFAMFNFERLVTLKQVEVKEFHWANPHVLLWVAVTDKTVVEEKDPKEPDNREKIKVIKLKPGTWYAELTSPGNLTRTGWTKRAFKPGDKVDLDISPLRDGSSGGAFKKAVLPDGKVWTSTLRAQERPGLGYEDEHKDKDKPKEKGK